MFYVSSSHSKYVFAVFHSHKKYERSAIKPSQNQLAEIEIEKSILLRLWYFGGTKWHTELNMLFFPEKCLLFSWKSKVWASPNAEAPVYARTLDWAME